MSDSPHLLYVDDEEPNLVVFRANFEDEFKLLTAQSGAEALRLFDEHEIGLVITDERMDGMRGSALLEQVKQRSPDTLRVVVTAYNDLDTVLRAVNTGGVWRYLTKPWEPEQLRILLQHGLELYGVARERRALQVQLMLSERRAIVGVLAGTMGHELRNALAGARANVSFLKDFCQPVEGLIAKAASPDAPAAFRDFVKEHRLSEDVAELASCVADLETSFQHVQDVSVGLVEAMRPPKTTRAAVDLSALVESMRRVFSNVVVNAGAQFSLEVEPDVRVSGDPVAIRQIVLNLLLNGAQATAPERGPGHVTLRCLKNGPGGGGRLEIEDRGTGIPGAVLARLFEPLFTTKGEKGTGLGLAVSRQLAEAQGGSLSVRSEEGVGTVFTLSLRPPP